MKKKILIFSVVSLTFACAFGQYTTVVTDDIASFSMTNTTNSMVRNWSGTDYCVTYSYKDGGVFRAMNHSDYTSGVVSPTFPIYEVALPSPLAGIVDFRIVGDYVCFGGYEVILLPIPSSIHYFGFFNLNDLVSGLPVNFRLIRIDRGELEKIEGFCDGYGFKVFAIGYYNHPINGNYFAIFEVDNPPSATGYNFVYTPNSLQMPNNEFFDDLVILEDRVVVVGTHDPVAGMYGPLSMRYMSKAMGISDPQLNFIYYQTDLLPTPDWPINSRIKAKPISGKKFVIAYTCTDSVTEASTRRTRVFDINLNNTVSQEYPIYSKLDLIEIAYNSARQTLTLLEPDARTTRFVFTHPENATPYTALTLFNPDYEHISLDTITSTQFVSTREKCWLFQFADQLAYNPATTTNECINDGIERVVLLNSLTKTLFYYGLNPNSGGGLNFNSKNVIIRSLKSVCMSK